MYTHHIMSGLEPIPEENMTWDSYYTLYYDDDFQKHNIYINCDGW